MKPSKIMHAIENWSQLEVARLNGKTSITTHLSKAPLRLLPVSKIRPCCMVMLSNYGGGIVQNDQIGLQIEAHEHAKLLIASQANNKAYLSTGKNHATQVTRGKLANNALVVWFPDPLIPQKNSALHQVHDWDMNRTSILIIGEWFHSGRVENDENFAFRHLSSEIRIRVNNRLALLDRLQIDPQQINTSSAGQYKNYTTSLNFYFAGDPENPVFDTLATRLQTMVNDLTGAQSSVSVEACRISLSQTKSGFFVLKAAGHNRMAIQPVIDQLARLLAEPEWLGVNWLKRKY